MARMTAQVVTTPKPVPRQRNLMMKKTVPETCRVIMIEGSLCGSSSRSSVLLGEASAPRALRTKQSLSRGSSLVLPVRLLLAVGAPTVDVVVAAFLMLGHAL